MVGSSGGKKRRKVSGGTVEVGGSYDHVYQCVDMEVLTVESLYHLLNRAVAMCFPQADQSPFHAHLVSVMTNSRTLLQPYPIDTHALGSPQMQLRGEVCRSCFRNFVTTLGEHSQFYAPPPTDAPELRRGLSSTLAKMEDTLRDTTKLVEAQHSDPILRPIRAALEAGRGEDADYVLADNNLLWHAPRGRTYAIAVPKRLVPAVLALVHGTYGHPRSPHHVAD